MGLVRVDGRGGEEEDAEGEGQSKPTCTAGTEPPAQVTEDDQYLWAEASEEGEGGEEEPRGGLLLRCSGMCVGGGE